MIYQPRQRNRRQIIQLNERAQDSGVVIDFEMHDNYPREVPSRVFMFYHEDFSGNVVFYAPTRYIHIIFERPEASIFEITCIQPEIIPN